ncbi:MAG: tRNA pseudouridine(38-40) synthase TruA [Gammaproteobacteria bacterium]|nr:tRNA pseudouridine(38-40) synthase TruA [Gammaproteobacteria bacterium]MBQ0840240.1 tRNA pseudouridine(38-40) synthase TruA [Gammaproteobacteria bacterium]
MPVDNNWNYLPNCKVPEGEKLPSGTLRYGAVVEYEGSGFCGWQRQPHCVAVQQEVEKALSSVAAQALRVSCAGRTDAGVHAWHQVIHFDTTAQRAPRNWMLGANANLPASVRLHWVENMPAQFHARFSAVSRTYRYLILNRPVKAAVMHSGLSWCRQPLSVQPMAEAAQALLGEQDFSAFRGAGCQSNTPMRNVKSIEVFQQGDIIAIEICANAFLLHMVRNIAGALMAVGRGQQKVDWLGKLLAGRDRTQAAATAPSAGLYLIDVGYPEQYAMPYRQPPAYLLGAGAAQ